ncbi:MAG: tRNA-dihydrouridine synthase family protein [Candidatus Pacearchaeota archaeon]
MKIRFKNPLLLAPMLEPNDIAFRLLCKKAGAGGVYTGMINPLSKKKLFLDDKPILQIFCNKKEGIKDFIKKYDKKVSGWDFNLGCPSNVAEKLKFGAYLEDLGIIEEILKELRKYTKKFLSVKIRKSEHSFSILKIAEKYCDALIIHPRTKEQGYSGKADLDFALQIKRTSKIPIIYSGDVSEKNAIELSKKFDFVMIGRAAIGNPNIFAVLTSSKRRFFFNDYIKLAKNYKLPFSQIKFQALNFTKGTKNATKIRAEIIKAKNIEAIEKIYSFNKLFK